MAEVVAVITAVFAIAEILVKSTQKLSDFLNTDRSALKEIKLFSNEATTFIDIIYSFCEIAENRIDSSNGKKTRLKLVHSIRKECAPVAEELVKLVNIILKVKPFRLSSAQDIWARIIWVFKRPDVDLIRGYLASAKTSILCAMGFFQLEDKILKGDTQLVEILNQQLLNTIQELKRTRRDLEDYRRKHPSILNSNHSTAYTAITENNYHVEKHVVKALQTEARKVRRMARFKTHNRGRPVSPVRSPSHQGSGAIPSEPTTMENHQPSHAEKQREGNSVRHNIRDEIYQDRKHSRARARARSIQRSPPPSSPRRSVRERRFGDITVSELDCGEVDIVKSVRGTRTAAGKEAKDSAETSTERGGDPRTQPVGEAAPPESETSRPSPQGISRIEAEGLHEDASKSKNVELPGSLSHGFIQGDANNETEAPRGARSDLRSGHPSSPHINTPERNRSRDRSPGQWRAVPPFGGEGDRRRPRKRRSPSPTR